MVRHVEGRRLPVFLSLCALLVTFQAYVIFWQPHGVPSTTAGERRTLGEVAATVVATQTFEVGANGLEAVTVYTAPSPGADGPVVFELAELVGDPAVPQRLFRETREAAEVGRGGPYTWRFSPLEASRGKRYALTVSMPHAPFGEGRAIRLEATRGERYGAGRLVYDGRDQWGDLVFAAAAARATSFRRFEHALRDEPWWLRSRVTLAAGFVAYNLALFSIFWVILSGPAPAASPAASHALPARARLALAAVVVAIAGAVWFWWVPRRPWLEPGAMELLDRLPEASLRTTMASLQQAFAEGPVTVGRRRFRCLTALPFSRVNFTVDVPPDAEFAAWVGMRPDVWEGPGDGALFRIGFAAGGAYDEPWRRHFHPAEREIDRTLAPVRLDLSRYAGQRIEVILNTEPEFNAVGDAALWCEPRIVRR